MRRLGWVAALGVMTGFAACGCGSAEDSSLPYASRPGAPPDDAADAGPADTGADSPLHDAEPPVDAAHENTSDAFDDGPFDDVEADQDAGSEDAGPALLCHGRADLCDRPYNQVAQACTHNAMSSSAYGFLIPTPNQRRSFTEQLDDGVRCLMLDTYSWKGDVYLCHGECGFWGAMPLIDGLDEIHTWMLANPTEVVTFIFEADIDQQATWNTLVESGLADASETPTDGDVLYYHEQPPGSPWPTLRWMVEHSQRLVTFTDDGNADGRWYLDWRAYGWETPWDDPTFTCEDNRGDPMAYDNQVFILNHFTISSIGGSEQLSSSNNAFDVLWDHAARCWQPDPQFNPWEQIPTFVTVDQYHTPTKGGATALPDVFDVVNALNDAWPSAPGGI